MRSTMLYSSCTHCATTVGTAMDSTLFMMEPCEKSFLTAKSSPPVKMNRFACMGSFFTKILILHNAYYNAFFGFRPPEML